MDRLSRGIIVCGFGLLVTASGCRSTRTEVPPGKPFANDGKPRKAIEFSTDPHPVDGSSSANLMPYNTNGSNIGASRPNASAFGTPPGAYGPPGTSGMSPPAVSNEAPSGNPPAGAPDLDVPAARPEQQAPGPIAQPSADKPPLGAPDQMPSPY